MIFVGVDLAWSPQRTSGVVALHPVPDSRGRVKVRTLWAHLFPDHRSLLRFLLDLDPPEAHGLLVDAPLRGSGPFRPAERALMPLLRPLGIGLLPVPHLNLDPLLTPLRARGYRLYPEDFGQLCRRGGWIVEVYPQATAAGLLRQRLPYKRGPAEARRRAWHGVLRRLEIRLASFGIHLEAVPEIGSTHLRDAWVAALGAVVACQTGGGRRFPEFPPDEPYLWVPWLPEERA